MSDRHAVKINDDHVDRISAARRTSPCLTAVRNMGMTPRLYLPAASEADIMLMDGITLGGSRRAA
jgi:hypothetical protein